MRLLLWLFLSTPVFTSTVFTSAARAEDATLTARQIFERAEQTRKVDNSIQTLRMVLIGRNGAERVRELEMKVRRDDDVLSSYTRFSEPSDVAGTQLVVVDHPDQLDEQLLYLPALKRVQRISGRARSGSFMGSDFAFEDLELSQASRASHQIIDETEEFWIIETTPTEDSGSSYGKLISQVHKVDYLPRKIEYFDQRGRPLKVLTVTETTMDGETIIPRISVMKNVQKNTATRLEILSHQLNVEKEQIPEETFTPTFMERNG
ncbi:MAG: outer membrane lipoprotein-sorting protein [Myxococcota bacterium]